MSNEYIDKFKTDFEKIIEHFKGELKAVRTNRANPEILENILVDVYGTKTPIKQIASISVPEARTIMIEPWDKNIIKDIEKAITYAEIGLSPSNEGTFIRLTLPQMTEEKRMEIVKNIKDKLEKTRISIRQVRDKIKEDITKAEKNNELTEDDRYKHVTDLDNKTNEYVKQADEMADEKEKEVMTI